MFSADPSESWGPRSRRQPRESCMFRGVGSSFHWNLRRLGLLGMHGAMMGPWVPAFARNAGLALNPQLLITQPLHLVP